MSEEHAEQPASAPVEKHWNAAQFAVAVVLLVVGVGLYVLDRVDVVLWESAVDFGWLPVALLIVALYVLFDLWLPDLLNRARGKQP